MSLTIDNSLRESVGANSMAVLKMRTNNERVEIEFELDYMATLTTQQRFEMMLRKSREMAALRKRHGSRRVQSIVVARRSIGDMYEG